MLQIGYKFNLIYQINIFFLSEGSLYATFSKSWKVILWFRV